MKKKLEVREVMDINQAADYLRISADALYGYAKKEEVPAFRFGNRWRFKKSCLDEWMERQSRVKPSNGRELTRIK